MIFPAAPMIDILVYLFENYADFADQPQPEALARKLNALGFPENDISRALLWLTELQHAPREVTPPAATSLRLYTAQEHAKLGEDALAFLAFLETAGVVDAGLRELIVERTRRLPDDPVDFEDFKIVVLMVLWCRETRLDPLIIDELISAEPPQYLH